MKINDVLNLAAQVYAKDAAIGASMRETINSLSQVVIPKEVEEKFVENGRLKEMSCADYLSLPFPVMFNLMNKYSIYVAPTIEFLDYLDDLIGDKSCIEICAGMGYIGKGLNLEHITDSYVQVSDKEVNATLIARGGVPTNPPSFVEKLEAVKAVKKYHPHTVLVCYGTHKDLFGSGTSFGVDYKELKRYCRRIIFVGNALTHRESPILRMAQTIQCPDGLVTKSANPEHNLVAIWER